jgi:hypothetical protein
VPGEPYNFNNSIVALSNPNLKANYSNSDFDIRNVLVADFIWDSPFIAMLNVNQVDQSCRPWAGIRIENTDESGRGMELRPWREGAKRVASNLEAELSYGLTRNIKLAVSGPVVFQPDPYIPVPQPNQHADQR